MTSASLQQMLAAVQLDIGSRGLQKVPKRNLITETRGDVQEVIDTAFYFAGEGRRLFGQTTTSELAEKFGVDNKGGALHAWPDCQKWYARKAV